MSRETSDSRLGGVFPVAFSNAYRGHPLALWAFAALTVLTLVRSCIHMLSPDGGAESIATIPLHAFSFDAAATVILIFAFWGLSQFILGLVYVAVLWRYRNAIPFFYLLMMVEYGGRMLFGHLKPIETTGTAPGSIGDYIMLPLALILFVLSLPRRRAADGW